MPEPRDRLSRPEDISEMFSRRRRSIGGGIGILADEEEIGLGIPFRWGDTAMAGTPGQMGVVAMRAGGGGGRVSLGTPRMGVNGRARHLYRSPAAVVGQQNMMAIESDRQLRGRGLGLGRGRGRSSSVLPSWYPRTPLRDITTFVRAIERRRAHLRETEGQHIGSPLPQDQAVLDSSVPLSGAPLEHNVSIISPNPTIEIRPCPPSVGGVTKILLDINNQNAGESDLLEKVVEELRKLNRTPSAKKTWREKRVRTLMSMR